MIKKIFLFLLLLFPLLGEAGSISISAKYSEAANTFVIMDCLSGWWDKTFCQDDGGEFQKYWAKRFGLTSEDRDLFKQYDVVRQKYYKGLGLPKDDIGPFKDGLFSKRSGITEDQIAPSFYSSDTLEQSYGKLEKVIKQEDLVFLKSFHKHFKVNYQILLSESEPFRNKTKELNRKLQDKKYADFFAKISRYYSVAENMKYEVLYTWFPPLDRDSASPTNSFLVFQQHPIKHIDSDDEDIVFHEIIHTISARQPQKQKEEISKTFLEACPNIKEKFIGLYRGRVLEEPMAVTIGQIIFLKKFFPKRLKWDSKLYNNPWISEFAKLIYPVIESELDQNNIFSVETGKKLGFLCNEFFQASN
ncbi:MAG: hypothetical protein Q7U04_11670, partial [Bacteriovorax sp.]|nr:hypothetical protein [Bacteriovorax sp.]